MDYHEHKFEHHPQQLGSADRREGLHRALLVRNKILLLISYIVVQNINEYGHIPNESSFGS